MDPELLQVLKTLLPGHKDKVYKGIVSMLGLEGHVVSTGDDDEDETTKSITIAEVASKLKGLGYEPRLPGLEFNPRTSKSFTPPYNTNPITPANAPEEGEEEDEAVTMRNTMVKAFYMSRFKELPEAQKAIMSDIVGADYQATIFDQNAAFAKYLRRGERAVTGKEMKLLTRQIFPEDMIFKSVIEDGFDVATIKATQVEAQGELGGIAVPPNRQSEITTRLPGLTAVRGAGANVITLVNSNSTEIPQWRTDDTTHRYIGMLRGEWGNETADPNAKNFKLDLVPLVANIYTYKVPLSQSLVEDAANLVTMLMNDITVTLAIDEDEQFLIGDGVGKPHGILPNGLNANNLTEVVSASAAALTPNGIKALKRGVASQYRREGVFVAESATYGVIERMRDDAGGAGTGQFLFPDLTENETLLARRAYESEAMPSVGAGTFPLLFGNMRGYDIVERLGMTIQRFQDSNTGINKVEYHVRKRVGGKLERFWMFAVQKVAAS